MTTEYVSVSGVGVASSSSRVLLSTVWGHWPKQAWTRNGSTPAWSVSLQRHADG